MATNAQTRAPSVAAAGLHRPPEGMVMPPGVRLDAVAPR